LYPDQIKIIKQFISKFDCIQNHIILFLREYRLAGVENKKCSIEIHDMHIGDTAYVYNVVWSPLELYHLMTQTFCIHQEVHPYGKEMDSIRKDKNYTRITNN